MRSKWKWRELSKLAILKQFSCAQNAHYRVAFKTRTGRRGMEMGKGNEAGEGDGDGDGDGEAGKDIEHPFITQWGYAGHIKSIWAVRAGCRRASRGG